MTSGPRTLYACPKCGCTDVYEATWVHCNSSEPSGPPLYPRTRWCARCDDTFDESRTPGLARCRTAQPDPYVGPPKE